MWKCTWPGTIHRHHNRCYCDAIGWGAYYSKSPSCKKLVINVVISKDLAKLPHRAFLHRGVSAQWLSALGVTAPFGYIPACSRLNGVYKNDTSLGGRARWHGGSPSGCIYEHLRTPTQVGMASAPASFLLRRDRTSWLNICQGVSKIYVQHKTDTYGAETIGAETPGVETSRPSRWKFVESSKLDYCDHRRRCDAGVR